jgi:hypothetical protein
MLGRLGLSEVAYEDSWQPNAMLCVASSAPLLHLDDGDRAPLVQERPGAGLVGALLEAHDGLARARLDVADRLAAIRVLESALGELQETPTG